MRKREQITSNKKASSRIMTYICDQIAIDRSLFIEMRGRDEIVIRGCRRICDYGPHMISLKLKSGNINVCGEKLTCYAFSGSHVSIRGRIKCVFFKDDKAGDAR